MAATSWKRAGNCTDARARVTRTTPSSNGWRSPSSTAGWNSPSSSKNRTPPLASETSPGRMLAVPPPTMATSDAVWCGARSGGRETRPPGSGRPAAEWIMVVSSATSRSNPGRRRGQPLRQHGLPRTRLARAGGDGVRRRRPPRTAMRAMTCPRTSARSGAGSIRCGRRRWAGRRPLRPAGQHGDQLRHRADGAHLRRGRPAGLRSRTRPAPPRPGPPARRPAARCPAPAGWNRPGRARPGRPVPASAAESTAPEATSTPTAIARSSPDPLLRTPDGARLTVMRLSGQVRPLDMSAAADAVPRLPARLVGQADDAERRQAVGDVHLDRDRAPLGTEQRG